MSEAAQFARFRRMAAAAGMLCIAAGSAFANPKGGEVAAGAATIEQTSPSRLEILQSTDRAIIDWQNFNIAPSQWTAFQQPGSGAVTLNRVEAADPSVIAGKLTANGSLVLINPSGVTFSKGAQVNVNSLIATPAGIGNANFMAGRMKFNRASADPRATVVNRGRITVAEHGLAALVAPGAANSGTIRAKLGRVVVAGAETYTVDFYGDGLISFDVGAKVKEVPTGPGGKPVESLVSNSGKIEAPGGTVLLTADAAGGIIRNVVDDSGTISARTNGKSSGSVVIDAGPGAANLSGTINVGGYARGRRGGSATVTGHSVRLTRTARIDASGDGGGGTVRIGGGAHGRDPRIPDAATTTVARGARIDASATRRGAGGRVTVWSDRATHFAGTIRAVGGWSGGAGGWIETSGRIGLAVLPSARIDAAAPAGKIGRWLLDPGNLTVTNADRSLSQTGGTFKPTGDDATIAAALIERVLSDGTDVTLTTIGAPGTQNGNIRIAANGAISWKSAAGLTLDAAGNITIGAPVTATGAGSFLALDAGGNISIRAPVALDGRGSSVDLTAGGAVAQSAAGIVATNVLDINSVGAVSLPQANSVGTLAFTVTGAGNGVLFHNAGRDLTLGFDDGTSVGTNGGPITVFVTGTSAAGFDLTIPRTETVFSTGGTITLSAGGRGALFTNGGTIDSTGTGISGDIVLLADAMNLAAGTVDAGAGTVLLGPVTTTDAIVLGAGGSTGVLGLTSADLASVTAAMLQIGYRNKNGTRSLSGNIAIASPLAIDTATVPSLLLVTGGAVVERAGGSIGATKGAPAPALGIIAGGPVSMRGANAVGTLAGFVDGPGNGFFYRNNGADLTIGTLANSTIGVGFAADGIPSSAVIAGGSANPLAGVTTAGGNIVLETTTTGNLALAAMVDADNGAVGLASAGSLTQDPAPIIAASLAIISADRVSLGAFGGPADRNQVGTLAALVLDAGESFVFRNDMASLTIGTVDLARTFGRLANPATGRPLPAVLSGVTTDNANIGLRVTSAGNLVLAANVDAGNAGVGLESAGAISQTAGAVIGGTLEVSATGSVSLPDANAVAVLAGRVTGAGSSFLFRDDSRNLTIGTAPALRESGVGTPPDDRMLSVGALSGVTSSGGDIQLETTTSGDLVLSHNVDAGAGSVALLSAGNAVEKGGIVDASGLAVDAALNVFFGIAEAGGTVALGLPNDVGTLAGNAGGVFGFLNGPGLTIGTVPAILDAASQSGIKASAAATGDVLIETDEAGAPLTLAADIGAGGRTLLDTAGGFAETGAVAVASPVLAIDTTGDGIGTLLAAIPSSALSATAIGALPPAATSNALVFADLIAPQTTVLLVAGRGALTGTMTVGQLGLSGTGANAALFGSIAGVAGPTAALLGVRDPGPEPAYLFNNCIIAGVSCTIEPTAFLTVPPQPALELTALVPLPNLAAVVEFITPEEVEGRRPANPDAPVINIFDEERLCAETGTPSQPAKERCREHHER